MFPIAAVYNGWLKIHKKKTANKQITMVDGSSTIANVNITMFFLFFDR